MKTLISTTALVVAFVGASSAVFGDAHIDPETMTCADFAALELADQEIAVAAIEATKMEMAEAGDVDEAEGTAAEAEGTEDVVDDSVMEEPTEGEPETDMAEASPVVEGLLAACDANDDVLAIDACES